MTSLLKITDLHAAYGSVGVLHGVNLQMRTGENIGLFGPNGHGKTTLLRVISGLMKPSTGTVQFDGEDITGMAPAVIVSKGLVQSQQLNTLFGDMAVAETLELAAFTITARAKIKDTLSQVYALFPRLIERGSQKAKTLSGGERQMLSIGAALMCAPRLLLLDEPTLGLSPKLKEELTDTLLGISAEVPVIVVEQDVELLLRLSDRLYLIEQGQVVHEINHDSAPDYQEIMAMYFGDHNA